jgi:hypothetical protein
MLPPSVRLAAEALRRATISEAVVSPALSISSRVMTCTGSAVSPSMRLIAEPVISMRCGASGVLWAWPASGRAASDRRAAWTARTPARGRRAGGVGGMLPTRAGHGIPPEAV